MLEERWLCEKVYAEMLVTAAVKRHRLGSKQAVAPLPQQGVGVPPPAKRRRSMTEGSDTTVQ